jgi:hypothetical protein
MHGRELEWPVCPRRQPPCVAVSGRHISRFAPAPRQKNACAASRRGDPIYRPRCDATRYVEHRGAARRVTGRKRYWIWIWSITAVARVTVDDESLAVTTSLSVTVLPANADRSRLLRAVKLDSLYEVNPEIVFESTT